MKSNTSNRGFTLVELLVVIAIIALLTGVILTSLVSSKAKSRDATRVSDLNQIQLALEQYFDRCGQYPNEIVDTNASNGCPTTPVAITLASYISVIPTDPLSSNTIFTYAINTTNPSVTPPTNYILHTTFESSNASQQNSYPELSRQSDMAIGTWAINPTIVTPSGNGPTFNCYSSTYPKDYCISTK